MIKIILIIWLALSITTGIRLVVTNELDAEKTLEWIINQPTLTKIGLFIIIIPLIIILYPIILYNSNN